jgi:hypothetical protein
MLRCSSDAELAILTSIDTLLWTWRDDNEKGIKGNRTAADRLWIRNPADEGTADRILFGRRSTAILSDDL